ncbi:AQG_2a_G0034400.mRNA.1.CDS.1 [Saccharomyces cerevisiae]|uniref:Transcription initiation factor IIE subunit beta n=9 Tax=Saccharomyces TaxID=4930 RepID=T2EB_YEAST|nr:transcription factor TFIIE subunit TFA2 [Saccharomyces cerevisiae S288C]P36145.3 RecName: Full=Transcription initiation factor IIE subunit beta; Short=TFIIE-beta; AltName: Full=Factor A 43 kDa subunit; AltName: Full=Transcription factor A small subunit [Saccharomyces cerevisiae S288C]5FYW_X Chain X, TRANSCRIPTION INITIATION FACTOR IIE SUBUNIT BETA [Saccharomyces cerevisiae]5FZ5_X Chain X, TRANSCRIPTION INITIATION FACTOR IIE SUBUNIT BETA [Saccharomyces cerevisiae]5OQJ_X Chain X, Transcription|eukprot:NP_012988.1 transcription factor TFIIE subunit TFA2 [Saccharomyces cerevisiae S288C]
MSKNRDPLLANLNAFKSKVKSAPVIAPAKVGQKKTNDTVITIDGNTRKRTASERAQENTLNSAKNPVLVDIKKEAGSNSSNAISLDDDDDDEDFGSSPSKKVRPGSIAAAALQANQTDISKSHDSSKLLWATEYIQKKGKPVLVNELLDYLSMKKDDKVIELLKKLDRIEFDPKKGTFKYLSTYDVHSPSELLKLLRSQVTFKGISCKDLKDGWPQCDETINQLEEDSKILVLRTKKDKTPRYVWYNSGGNLKCIDEEFVKMWENVQLPQFAELPRKLQDLGLKPASVDPATIKRQTKRVEVKKKRQRKGKITNTHMTGILKDYSHRV